MPHQACSRKKPSEKGENTHRPPHISFMSINYEAPAELFTYSRLGKRPRSMAYRRFRTTAEALRYAIEVIPGANLPGTVIEVNEDRICYKDIRKLYKDRRARNRRRKRRIRRMH